MEKFNLSKNEMKKVLGGAQNNSTTCSTSCKNGTTISITCVGPCWAESQVKVFCSTGEEKKCPTSVVTQSVTPVASVAPVTMLAFR